MRQTLPVRQRCHPTCAKQLRSVGIATTLAPVLPHVSPPCRQGVGTSHGAACRGPQGPGGLSAGCLPPWPAAFPAVPQPAPRPSSYQGGRASAALTRPSVRACRTGSGLICIEPRQLDTARASLQTIASASAPRVKNTFLLHVITAGLETHV